MPKKNETTNESFRLMLEKPELLNHYLEKKMSLMINQKLLEGLSQFKFSMGHMFDSFVTQNREEMEQISTKVTEMATQRGRSLSDTDTYNQKVKF